MSLGRIYLLFCCARGDVFGKQSGPGVAEFLSYVLIRRVWREGNINFYIIIIFYGLNKFYFFMGILF